MVLHHVTDNAKFVEITSSPFRTEWFFERNLNIVDVIPVPRRPEKLIAESENQNILYHLLSKIMGKSEYFLLLPVWLECPLQFS